MSKFSPSVTVRSKLSMRARLRSGVTRPSLLACRSTFAPFILSIFNLIVPSSNCCSSGFNAAAGSASDFSTVTSITLSVRLNSLGKDKSPSSLLRDGSASLIAVINELRRSIPAENELSCSNWFTMTVKSLRIWLNAPTDCEITPS